MNRVIALAQITFINGLRRNAVWGLCLFSLLIEISGILFMDFFGHNLGRVISDFQFSIMYLSGMIFILFYAVQAVAWDDDHKGIDGILARPISRTEYVLGLLAGLTTLLLCFELILGSVALGTLIWAKQALADVYFPLFSSEHYLLTWSGLQMILMTHLAMIILISAAIRGPFPVMLITLAYSLICSGLPVVRQSVEQMLESGSDIHGLSIMLQGLNLIFPDFSRLDYKNSILSEESIESIAQIPLWIPFSTSILYIAIVIWISCFIYHRRDIL